MPAYKDKERGTWFVEFRYTDQDGKRKKKKKRGFRIKKEALEFEREFLANIYILNNSDNNNNNNNNDSNSNNDNNVINSFILPNTNEMTVRDLADLYIKDLEKRVKYGTYYEFTNAMNSKYFKDLMPLKVKDLSPIVLRNWQLSLSGIVKAKTSFRLVLSRLNAVLNYGHKFYNVENNLKKSKVKLLNLKEKKEINILSTEDLNLILQHIKNKEIKLVLILLYNTGMRIGEALGLSINDIDMENKKISINKTHRIVGDKELITTPKTSSSIRCIDVSEHLIELIKQFLENRNYVDGNTRLFTMVYSEIKHRLNYIFEKYTHLKAFRLHDLRHSHASYLLSKKINIVAISRRLGHSTVSMTLDVYSHLMDNDKDKLLKTLNEVDVY